jgi:hypothetical protein
MYPHPNYDAIMQETSAAQAEDKVNMPSSGIVYSFLYKKGNQRNPIQLNLDIQRSKNRKRKKA